MLMEIRYPLPIKQKVQAYQVAETLQGLATNGQLKRVDAELNGGTITTMRVQAGEQTVLYRVWPGRKENEYLLRVLRTMKNAYTFTVLGAKG